MSLRVLNFDSSRGLLSAYRVRVSVSMGLCLVAM